MLVARRADPAQEACRRPDVAAPRRATRAATAPLAAVLALACVPAAYGQTVEIRVTNDFSRALHISRDEFNCKPSPCIATPSATVDYGAVGEPTVATSGNLAMATVFYKATVNHKSYGCRFSLTVTKTRGSCDVAQILISPYLTQDGNSPKCSILEPSVPTYPDCRFVVTFAMSN